MPFYHWVLKSWRELEEPDAKVMADDIMKDAGFPRMSLDKTELAQHINKMGKCQDCFNKMYSIYEKEAPVYDFD